MEVTRMIQKRLAGVVAALVFAAMPLYSPSHAADDSGFDIVGMNLGMTYEQVVEALGAHNVQQSDMLESRLFYSYSDGVINNHRTEDFLFRLDASVRVPGNQDQDSFRIYFSPPPDGGRVVAIERSVRTQTNPPTNEQYRNAVYQKYGPPTVAHNNTNVSQWLFGSGSMNCLETSLNAPVAMPVRIGRGRDSSIILERVFHASGSTIMTDRFRNGRVNDLSECANILQYSINGYSLGNDRAFNSADALLIDVQSWVNAEFSANAWVEELRQQATAERLGRGTAPVL